MRMESSGLVFFPLESSLILVDLSPFLCQQADQVDCVRRNTERFVYEGLDLLVSNAVRHKFGSLCHFPVRNQHTKHRQRQSGPQTTDIRSR